MSQEKYIGMDVNQATTGHEPLIEPWLTSKHQVRLPESKTRLAWSPPADENHGKWQTSPDQLSRVNRGAHAQAVGWISRQKSSRRPVEGETFS
jgi:hypothetical protein